MKKVFDYLDNYVDLVVITLLVLAMLFVIAVPSVRATGVPAYYNADKFYSVDFQAWDTIADFDTISDGVTVLSGEDFLTTPGTLLQISGRCFLEYPVSFFYARLAVWYDANIIPKTHPLAFTDDRTVTFAYTFTAGERLQLQLYTDGGTVPNRVRCNVLFEAVE